MRTEIQQKLAAINAREDAIMAQQSKNFANLMAIPLVIMGLAVLITGCSSLPQQRVDQVAFVIEHDEIDRKLHAGETAPKIIKANPNL